MKAFIAVVVVCCAIGLSESVTKEQRNEMFIKLATECAKKESASKGDIDELAAHKPASTTGGKCLRACIFESVGMLKNNHIDVDGTVAVTAMAFEGEPAKADMARDLATACTSVTDANRCEAATKILDCGHDTAKQRGLSFEQLFE